MNFIGRAWRNVSRKLSKSILLALTFFVIGNFVIIGLGVSNAADQAKVLTRQKMRAVVKYEVDWQGFYQSIEDLTDEEQQEAYKNSPRITSEVVNSLKADSRVKTMNAITSTILYSDGFQTVPLGNKADEEQSGGESCWIDGNGEEICTEYINPDVKLQANAYPDMIEFADGMYVLKEGRMYTQEDIDEAKPVCLITDTLAEFNNLRVGDTIKVNSYSKNEVDGYLGNEFGITLEDGILELEIIGIFDNMDVADQNKENFDWMQRYESPENIILCPDSVYLQKQYEMSLKMFEVNAEKNPSDEFYGNPDNKPKLEDFANRTSLVILLNDPLEVDPFVEDVVNNMPENSFIKVDANNETFNQLAKPLDTLGLFASFIVWLVIINAVIIITLVTALTLKTREYEIGVLLAMGVTKMKIVMQFFVELAIVAIIGFSCAVLSGSLMAKQVGKTVLDYQVTMSDVQENEGNDFIYWGETDYFSDVTLDDIVSNYEVKISPIIIGEIYIAGLGIVLVSILIPSLMVMRFNPKRILMSAQ